MCCDRFALENVSAALSRRSGCTLPLLTLASVSFVSVTLQVAMSCKTGSATNIIYGLALGYKSAIIPVFVLAAIIFTSFQLSGTYGELLEEPPV